MWKLFVGIFLAVTASELKEELTGDEFAAAIKAGPVFAKFYAPWCGHCKKLAPAWSQLADELNDDEEWGVHVASVDCTQHKAACSENGVSGYPTLKFFKDGESIKYQGARTIDALRDWLDEHLDDNEEGEEAGDEPAAAAGTVVSLTSKTFKTTIAEDGVTFVKFFAPWCGHCKSMAPAWVELAKQMGDDDAVTIAEVDCTSNSEVCGDNGVKGYPTLKAFKKGKEIEKYQGARNLDGFKGAINKYKGAADAGAEQKSEPAEPKSDVAVLTESTFSTTIASGATFVEFYAPWCGHCKKLAPTWEELATKRKTANPKVKIANVDCTAHNSICKEHEVKGFPTILMFQDGKNLGKHQGGRDLLSLEKSILSFLDPNAKKTEEPAAAAAAGGSDFKKKIEGKHAFVKFFAPWCGHCKSMAPAWKELEDEYKEDDRIQVFEVDCTSADGKGTCGGEGVKGYPTVKYYKPGSTEGEKYAMGRDLKSMKNFVASKIPAAAEQKEEEHDEL